MNDQTSPEKAAMKDSGVQISGGAAGPVDSQSSDWWDSFVHSLFDYYLIIV
jgi:hypothetical protein